MNRDFISITNKIILRRHWSSTYSQPREPKIQDDLSISVPVSTLPVSDKRRYVNPHVQPKAVLSATDNSELSRRTFTAGTSNTRPVLMSYATPLSYRIIRRAAQNVTNVKFQIRVK
jgi:hypothetical protein